LVLSGCPAQIRTHTAPVLGFVGVFGGITFLTAAKEVRLARAQMVPGMLHACFGFSGMLGFRRARLFNLLEPGAGKSGKTRCAMFLAGASSVWRELPRNPLHVTPRLLCYVCFC